MATQQRCKNRRRLADILGKPGLNGIDYLEVSSDQTILRVYCANPVTLPFKGVAYITGGARIRGATFAEAGPSGERVAIEGELRAKVPTAAGKVITVTVNQPGDFSTYTLHLVRSGTDLQPPVGFDRQLSEVSFSFKVDCPSDFDCAPDDFCPPAALPEPEINYLAKDYASFRRLMLDRLSVIMPDWQERNPADVEIMLVELLAYVGDRLSYYQDAVATEAYLGTARRRSSLRRHARLLDYPMHDGCNARAWVCFDYAGADLPVPEGSRLLTRGMDDRPTLSADEAKRAMAGEMPEVFETLYPVTLTQARSAIRFYTWSDDNCCLPAGATRATLVRNAGLNLVPRDMLVFEEVVSPTTGREEDADPSHRHVVRLTSVVELDDTLPAPAVPLLEVTWDSMDALPFPLCLSSTGTHDEAISDVSMARGNVVLVDHGERVTGEDLGQVAGIGPFRPKLAAGPLTQQGRVRDAAHHDRLVIFDRNAPAAAATRWDIRDVRPAISLQSTRPGQAGTVDWAPQHDLLASDRFAAEFVVETEDDGASGTGSAQLRFGDNLLGRQPAKGEAFKATYRVGNGKRGNVGANSITRLVQWNDAVSLAGVLRVWNPLPAVGGQDPEALEQVRQFAPQAFRVQQRAVTPADYVEVTQRRADVQRAAATMRWTGSWYTAFVTVDRAGGLAADARYEEDLRAYLDAFRMAGVDLEINGPTFVPLDLAIKVCVKDGYFRADVKQALLRAFGTEESVGPRARGFFHPDNFTFGQPVYLSEVFEAALAVDGVASVQAVRFQRWGRKPDGEVQAGLLTVGPFEVVRLDNDPNFPENGKIEFVVEGGL